MDLYGKLSALVAIILVRATRRRDMPRCRRPTPIFLALTFLLLSHWAPGVRANVPFVAAHPPLSQEQALANCLAWVPIMYPPNPVTGEHGDCVRGSLAVDAAGTQYYRAASPGGAWYDGIYFPFTDITDGPNMGDGGGCNGGTGGGGKCPKAAGAPPVGDPINPATGNKTVEETDNSTDVALTFRRFYNSSSRVLAGSMGAHWRHTFDRKLQKTIVAGFPTFDRTFIATRPDGKFEVFTKTTDGVWVKGSDSPDTLTDVVLNGAVTGYALRIAALRITERYSPDGLLQSIVDDSGQATSLTYSTTPSANAPAAGLLLSVTAPNGRQLAFAYDVASRLIQVTLSDAGVLNYSYDDMGNLAGVRYPDGTSKTYVYNEANLTGGANLPAALTGVTDEAGVRFENTTYNAKGWATSAGFSSGAGLVSINYNGDGSSDITFPSGARPRQYYAKVKGHALSQSLSVACGNCDDAFKSRTYDANARPATYTDFRGVVTATTYDANGLLTKKIEAQGRDEERTTETTWDAVLRVPLLRTTKDKSGTTGSEQGWAYNSAGLATAACLMDPVAAPSYVCSPARDAPPGVRRTVNTYCTAIDSNSCPLLGLLLTSDGPRTDVADTTSYTYYLTTDESGCVTVGSTCHHLGDLKSTTDGAGLVTTYLSYDRAGRTTRVRDPNGVLTDYAYTPRGWLATKTVRADAAGVTSTSDAITTIVYDPTGTVHSVQDPDGVTTTYTYDAAHRLTDITDASGARIHYTLDAAGNRTSEQVLTTTGAVTRSLGRTFNALGQLTALTDGQNRTVFAAGFTDSYDGNGNLVHSQDGLAIQQKHSYDGLNRLVSTVRDYQGSNSGTANAQSVSSFDALDRVTGFSDPDGLATTYGMDAFGNVTGLHSPDTGTTTQSFDISGNPLTSVDAANVSKAFTYDALGRLTGTSYPDTTLNVTYRYDEADAVTGCAGSFAKGHLTRVIESNSGLLYCYDSRGNVVTKQQTVGTVTTTTRYTWTLGDRLASVITANGTTIAYARDAEGRIATVTVTPLGGTATTVASNVTYEPFGPVASYTLGNGQTIIRAYDANAQLTDLTSPAFSLHLARDAVGNVTALGDAAGASLASETYDYDHLYRLTKVNDPSSTPVEAYTYSKTGDRLSKIAPGLLTGVYSYEPGTHRLVSAGTTTREVDARGNTTANNLPSGQFVYVYNQRNRLAFVQSDGITVGTYLLNAVGQRVQKTVNGIATRFDYDEAGHLLTEAIGVTSRVYVWLDDMPIGLVDQSASTAAINFIHADALGSPRVVTDTAGSEQWKWPYASNPFGEAAPSSSSGYTLNLRFPGQYFDAESGLNYNANRDYEPASGRYVQSDPMGLDGGVSTYGYVDQNPFDFVDPLGLQAVCLACHNGVLPGFPRPMPIPLPGPGSNTQSMSPTDNVIPFPGSRAKPVPKDECPQQDRCWDDQQKLITQRMRIEALISAWRNITPPEQMREMIVNYNASATDHNIRCPRNMVPLMNLFGPQR